MACPPRELFQIGWICALPIEAAAAREMLDESFGILDVQDLADTNTYSLGRIGKHHVAIACLPGGQYGTTSATTVANNMVRTFSKSLRIGLMVGVAGGIPSATHDIRLGDVVISYPTGTCGGVVQYDMGKVGLNREFHRTGSLNSPPRSLLVAVGMMRATELTDDPLYPKYLLRAIGRNDRTRKNLGRPETQQDRLFKCEYDHPMTASSCGVCLAEWEETRSERESNDPHLHYGIIASGNSVIKHGRTREKLRLSTGALCFEMEAAGLMQDFPCIVIRGICDYADSHKNKQWQGYAALAAASYAKELLGYIPVGRVAQESLAADACNELKDEVKGTNKRLDRAYDRQDQQHREKIKMALTDQQRRCHQAFKVSKYEEQKNINPRRVEGTCRWALQSPEYVRWLGSNYDDILWVSADPGCGKSVLARSIIDEHVEASSSGVTICYFFFKDNDEQNRLDIALCSALHQLFSQRPHLLPYAIPSWDKNGERLQHEVNELWRILTTAALADISRKTICIIDALDECGEKDQERLIEKLQAFYQQTSSFKKDTYLKFLVTSRPYDHIQYSFRAITDSFPYVHIKGEEENDRIHDEIDLVVKLRVKELAEVVQLPPEVHQRVEQQLLQMEHRTYLWLYLAIDDIRTTFEHSLRPTSNSITLIPPSVNAAYERILCRVPAGEMDTVKKILEIIVAARRPLTIQEMAVALGVATYSKARTTIEAGLDPTYLQRKLRKLCGLFVFTNHSKIYLIHQTAREFLIQKKISDNLRPTYWSSLSDAEDQMAEICLRLLMEDLEDDEGQPSFNIRHLLDYSAVHWADHVQKMSQTMDDEQANRLHRAYDTDSKLFGMWFPIFWKAVMPDTNVPSMNALNLAAFNGHEQEVHFQLAICKHDINMADGTGATPLIWASLNGHDKIVQMLLEHGADVTAQGGKHGHALQAACVKGHEHVAQMLLEWGADVNAEGGSDGNALWAACSRGHERVVQTLLDQGANVNGGGDLGNALMAACSRGYEKIVQMLLERGAYVNAWSVHHGNALQLACHGGYGKIVQTLLDQGANVNVQGGDYGNALQAACTKGDDKIVQMLLEWGADVSAERESDDGIWDQSAIQIACYQGDDKIVQMLLEQVADVNGWSVHHGNALGHACFSGHDRIVQTLLDQRADVNGGRDLEAALLSACSGGHDKIVQMLLKRGADVNAWSVPYWSALQAACYGGNDKIAHILLKRGADVNAQGGIYGNALQAACYGGHDKIAQTLLERGADINAQGGEYRNALLAACYKGHDKIARMLLERGADANAQGGHYGNALQAACCEGNDKIAQMLLEGGADTNAQGGNYGNALHAACYRGHDKIAQILLKRGADANAQGGHYGNALQAACCEGNDKIAQMLLEGGANTNAQGGIFGNALQAACYKGHDKIARMLLERGADANAQGGHYGNALHAACFGGHDKIAQMLLERGADTNAQSGQEGSGQEGSALQAACYRGHDKIAQMLLNRGVDVNAQGGALGNALQAACCGGHDIIAQTLLEQGANINAQGGRFGNALQAACYGGHNKIAQMLLERGANFNAQSGEYRNALQAARRKGYHSIVQALQEYQCADQSTSHASPPSKRLRFS